MCLNTTCLLTALHVADWNHNVLFIISVKSGLKLEIAFVVLWVSMRMRMVGAFALVWLVSVSFGRLKLSSFPVDSDSLLFPQTKTSGVCSAPDLPDLGEVPRHRVSLQQFAPQQTSDWGTSPHILHSL